MLGHEWTGGFAHLANGHKMGILHKIMSYEDSSGKHRVMTKYGRLPFKEGLNNNQLATATRASKGTRRERCPEDVMAVAPLGCSSINEGIHY